MYVIILDAILSYFPKYQKQEWAQYIRKAADFTEAPIRKYLPKDVPMDPSPLIVIILLQLIKALW
tara:strand:+ start:3702 stop:3896 length:195 start_codon:yes stop_codon:yes gene_type:complete